MLTANHQIHRGDRDPPPTAADSLFVGRISVVLSYHAGTLQVTEAHTNMLCGWPLRTRWKAGRVGRLRPTDLPYHRQQVENVCTEPTPFPLWVSKYMICLGLRNTCGLKKIYIHLEHNFKGPLKNIKTSTAFAFTKVNFFFK